MKKILVALICAVGLVSCNENKTAYVDTTRLIQDYEEMKELEESFNERSTKLRQEMDSIAMGFQNEIAAYQQESERMSDAERQEAEAVLMQRQQILRQQQQERSGELRDESDAVIDSLITRVKDFVKVYGEENEYTYIFGSNETANIMYAKEGLDITDEVLEKMNEEYKNKK